MLSSNKIKLNIYLFFITVYLIPVSGFLGRETPQYFPPDIFLRSSAKDRTQKCMAKDFRRKVSTYIIEFIISCCQLTSNVYRNNCISLSQCQLISADALQQSFTYYALSIPFQIGKIRLLVCIICFSSSRRRISTYVNKNCTRIILSTIT